MKKLFLLLFGVWSAASAQNSFPASGDVTVGSNLNLSGNLYNSLSESIGSVKGDAMAYQGNAMPNYGMMWAWDTWCTGAPSFWLSGYGGIKFFTASTPRFAITNLGSL